MEARSRVAGGRRGGSTSCGAPALEPALGRLHKPSCGGPGDCLSRWPLPLLTRAALLALSPVAWTRVSPISAGLARGWAGPVGPFLPVTGHQPFLMAADSSPKQNRLSPFFPLAVSGLRLPSEVLQRLRRAGEGAPGPALPGLGLCAWLLGPRSALDCRRASLRQAVA